MKRYLSAIGILAGLVLIGAALLANEIGLDHNAAWGRGRILLFSCGLLVMAWAALFTRFAAILDRLRGMPGFELLWSHRAEILSTLAVLFALAVYVFFVSGGKWKNWPEITRYYNDLGVAFRSGRLDLNIQPPDGLSALQDPYEPSVRNNVAGLRKLVDKVWDLTFYKGRFYVYWGPGPAVLLAAIKFFYEGAIGDQYLTFAFLAGLLIFNALLILRLRRDLYAHTPVSLLVLGILVAALFCPIPWMLNRAAIYEATIAAGQFFLIGGLYLAYIAVARTHTSRTTLLFAGVLWAFAAASRTLILIPAGFLTLMISLWEWTEGGRVRPVLARLPKSLLLGLPLLLSLLAVAWYNWARFGSIFDTGLRYTLTFENLDKFYSESFSAYYALPSLWMFLFNGFQLQAKFPFLVATFGRSPDFLYLNRPGLYHAEDITGLVLSAPFVLFSIVSMVMAVRLAWNRYIRHADGTEDRRSQLLLWISLCLAGSGLLTFAAIILYFNITMRFLAEFLPSLIPLAVLGTWQGYEQLAHSTLVRRAYAGVVIAIGLASIVVSVLLAFSESHGTVQHYNPQLMRQLIRFFGG